MVSKHLKTVNNYANCSISCTNTYPIISGCKLEKDVKVIILPIETQKLQQEWWWQILIHSKYSVLELANVCNKSWR